MGTSEKVSETVKEYTQEISAMILQYVKGYAEDYLGEKQPKLLLQFLLTSTMLNVKQLRRW